MRGRLLNGRPILVSEALLCQSRPAGLPFSLEVRMRSLTVMGGLALALAGTTVLAQQPQPAGAPQPSATFAAGGSAVVVDVVVRDKAGKPVTDLRGPDFQLLEDDVQQTIGDVALVAPPPGTTGAALPTSAATAPTVDSKPVTAPTFVALVFDRLSPEARALAYKGALAYLDTAKETISQACSW